MAGALPSRRYLEPGGRGGGGQNLPIKVSCSSAEEESARPGYLARKMDEAVAQFAQVCMVEEGALPRPLKEPQVRPCAPAAAHVYKPFVYG